MCLDSNEDISQKQGKFIPLSFHPTTPTTCKHHDGSLATLASSCGLIDPLSLQHSQRPFPPTYNRGKSRLDYILVSANLAQSVCRSGILPYNAVFHSDHRACYVDFNAKIIFVLDTHPIKPPCYRQLQLHDPRIVGKYNDILSYQLNYHKIITKLDRLYSKAMGSSWTSSNTVEYNKIDKIITDSMLYAEQSSCKRYSSKFEWSPSLIRAVQTERFWKLQLKVSKGLPVAFSMLTRVQHAAGITSDPYSSVNLSIAIQELRRFKAYRRELQRNHRSLCKTYLEKLAMATVLHRAPHLDDPQNSFLLEG